MIIMEKRVGEMIETLELPDVKDELAYVVNIKTGRHPNGFSYIRQDCVNRNFLDLDKVLGELRDTLRAKRIIM